MFSINLAENVVELIQRVKKDLNAAFTFSLNQPDLRALNFRIKRSSTARSA